MRLHAARAALAPSPSWPGRQRAIPTAPQPAVAVTQVQTVRAYGDTFVYQADPSKNYGTSTVLLIDYGSGVTKQVYLKFVVSGVPADASLTSAKLRMTATNSSGAIVSAKPGSTNTWSEASLTWSGARSTACAPSTARPFGRGRWSGTCRATSPATGLQRDPDAGEQHADVL